MYGSFASISSLKNQYLCNGMDTRRRLAAIGDYLDESLGAQSIVERQLPQDVRSPRRCVRWRRQNGQILEHPTRSRQPAHCRASQTARAKAARDLWTCPGSRYRAPRVTHPDVQKECPDVALPGYAYWLILTTLTPVHRPICPPNRPRDHGFSLFFCQFS